MRYTPDEKILLENRVQIFLEKFVNFGNACKSGTQKADASYFSQISWFDIESKKILEQFR
jgi:hypothetical protein